MSVKFGGLRDDDNGWNGYDARPIAVKNFLAYSLKRLGLEHIDIYPPRGWTPTCRSRTPSCHRRHEADVAHVPGLHQAASGGRYAPAHLNHLDSER